MIYSNKKKLLEEIKRKRKIVNFLIEASRDDDGGDEEYGDELTIQSGVYSDDDGFDDGTGKGTEGIQTTGPVSQFDAEVMSNSALKAALNFLEEPKTNFEKRIEAKNAKKAGNQKVNNEKTLFYIMWLKGNKYWKALWHNYLDKVYSSMQGWQLDPDYLDKQFKKASEEGKEITSIDFSGYVKPTKDPEGVAKFTKFAREFKKKVYSSLSENMTQEKYGILYSQLYNQKFDLSSTDLEQFELNIHERYKAVNNYLESVLGIDKTTGQPRPNSGVNMDAVQEIISSISNDYNQTEQIEDEEIPDYDFDAATKKKIEKMSPEDRVQFIKDYEEQLDIEMKSLEREKKRERFAWEKERGITSDEKEEDLDEEEEITILQKVTEYKRIISQIQTKINSTQFLKSEDLYKLAEEFEKDLKSEDIELNELLELQKDYSVTNLDRLEDFYKIYTMLNLTVMSMEKEISEQSEFQKIPKGLDRFNLVKSKRKIRQEVFSEYSKKMNKFIDQTSDAIQAKIDKVAGVKYPDITKRLNFLKVSMEKYRSYINKKLHKSGLWTLQAISGETGTYSDASGLQKHISRVLLQAMWVQDLLKSDKLSELKTLTLQKWLDAFDSKYGLSKSMEGSSYQDLIKKLDNIEQENPKKFKSAKEKASKLTLGSEAVHMTEEEIQNKVFEILSNDPVFMKMQEDLDAIYDNKANIELEIENAYEEGNDDKAESLSYRINDISDDIYSLEEKIEIYQNKLIEKLKGEQGSSVESDPDYDLIQQINDIEKQIANAPSMKPFSYEMTGKGKTAKFEEKPFEKIGNIEAEEFTPANIFNKYRLAEPSAQGVKLSKDWQDAIKAYVNQASQKEQSMEISKEEIYKNRLISQKLNLKTNIDPKFISKMLEDKFSPYRQFHNMLVGDYFDSARSYSQSIKNEDGLRQAIIDWFHQNYNSDWLPNGLRSSKSPAGLKEGSNPADDDIWNEIVNYAIGLANCRYDEKNLRIIQNEKEQVNDLMKKYEKGDWAKVMTPPDLSIGDLDDIRLSVIARQRFFEKLVSAATFTVNLVDPRQRIKPKGSIAAAVIKDLYSPNFIVAFKKHIDSMPEKDIARIFDDAIKHVEFYQQYPKSVIDPADYIKARKL
jgi:hypothetical protein